MKKGVQKSANDGQHEQDKDVILDKISAVVG